MKLHEIKLLEAAVSEKPKFSTLDIQKGIELIKSKCSDSIASIKKGESFYRYDGAFTSLDHSYLHVVDPSLTERKSQHTTNQYTEIFDNHPEMKDYPKRSRSYIATMGSARSDNPNETVVLVPFNDVKIGIVHDYDIWDKWIFFDGSYRNIKDMNTFLLKTYDIKKWKDLVQLDQKLRVKKGTKRTDFLKDILKAYSPETLGFTCETTANLKWDNASEVWIGGPCVVIPLELLDKVKEEL